MERIKKLIVSIKFHQDEIELGELVQANDGNIYFKYYLEFASHGLEISPIKLAFNNIINKGEPSLFDGLHGVFNDSLPDGWGTLLLDRKLFAKGVLPGEIGSLDRLAYVGDNGMGALTYKPKNIESMASNDHPLDLDVLADEVQQVYEGATEDIIEQLFNIGGSSGGARPKIFIGYHEEKDHFIHGMNELPADYAHWIIKFQSNDLPDIANIEYAYHKMALAAGLQMSDCKLFYGPSGKAYFGTKRFDRVGNDRLHMHSASGLMHDNFAVSTMDYGHLMDAAFTLEKDIEAYEKVLRMAAFNIYAHNRDDHSKNFSFLMDQRGKWKLAPAYDLTFSYSSHGMHSTMTAGESASPGQKQLLELADIFDIKHANEIIEKVKDACSNWTNHSKSAGVLDQSSKLINKKIRELIKT